MANKKISELTSATPSANSVIPSSDSGGTVTNKVTLQSILDLETRWNIFKPGAPTNLSGTAGNGQVSLTWSAPTVLAQTPITDYIVQYSSNSGSTWTTFGDGTSTSTSATVTGLTNGTAYVFRVAAVNGVGQGSWSSISGSVTPGGDESFSSVSLLLHMDGSNGSTTFPDSSSSPKTVTANGGAAVSTLQTKFGGGSLSLNGTSSYLTIQSSTDLAPAGSAFTIEAWIYPTSSSTQMIFFRSGPNASAAWSAGGSNLITEWYLANGKLNWNALKAGGGPVELQSSATISLNQWQHVAVCYDGTTTRQFVNGTLDGSVSDSYDTSSVSSIVNEIGRGEGSAFFAGYIDEFRVTKSARYVSSFTPQNSPFLNP